MITFSATTQNSGLLCAGIRKNEYFRCVYHLAESAFVQQRPWNPHLRRIYYGEYLGALSDVRLLCLDRRDMLKMVTLLASAPKRYTFSP